MYGVGVPDRYTIASLLSAVLNGHNDGNHYEVTNFGSGSYILEQDQALLLDQLKLGKVPDIAIFYNGGNDSYAGVFSPGRPGWYMGSQSIETKLLGDHPHDSAAVTYPEYFISDYGSRARAFRDYYARSVGIIDILSKKDSGL